jgi:hypothetical protein
MDKIAAVMAELRGEQTRLRLELARVERVIEALEEAIGIAGRRERAAAMVMPTASVASPPAPPAAPYARLTLYEATAAFLTTVKEPQSSRQIADALRAGGFKTRSEDFTGTVRTMLRRRATPGIRATSDGKRWYSRARE